MAKKTKSKRKPNKAFMAPLQPSPALAKIVGYKPLPRTQIVKKLWGYIKSKKLQDKKNKRMIAPNDVLAEVFKSAKKVSMFDMMKHIKKNVKAA